jgi:hypothetical protein
LFVRSGIWTHALIRGPECSSSIGGEGVPWVWRLRPLGHPDIVERYSKFKLFELRSWITFYKKTLQIMSNSTQLEFEIVIWWHSQKNRRDKLGYSMNISIFFVSRYFFSNTGIPRYSRSIRSVKVPRILKQQITRDQWMSHKYLIAKLRQIQY